MLRRCGDDVHSHDAGHPVGAHASSKGWHGAHAGADGGYVVVVAALALVPLVAVIAMAVDLAVWHGRGAELQRVADAAAVAAAGDLASPQQAVATARQVIARNGLIDSVDGIEVDVEIIGPAHVRVVVADSSVRRGFATPFVGVTRVERQATAEKVNAVALGSPRNFLGTGNLAGTTDPYTGLPGVAAGDAEDFWLSVNGPCAGREQGDWLLPVSVGNYISDNPPLGRPPWRGCTAAADPLVAMSPSHDPSGYFVAFVVPVDYGGGPFTIQVFDASRCNDSLIDYGAAEDPFWTRMGVLGADATPNDPTDNPVIRTEVFPTGSRCGNDPVLPGGYACGASGSWKGRWCNLAVIDTPLPGGIYFVRVDTGPVEAGARHVLNSFGLRVRPGPPVATGDFTPCTTDATDGAVAYLPATCIQVYAVSWMSIFAVGRGVAPTFFLAEVGNHHSGSIMEIRLFDIGEGADALQILDPLGFAAGFAWEVINEGGQTTPTGGWSGVVAPGGSLDVRGLTAGDTCSGGNPQPGPGRYSSSKYNDRLLRLRLALPADIAAAYQGRQWWRVRYSTCAGRAATDRTTWGVAIDGQPLRLVR